MHRDLLQTGERWLSKQQKRHTSHEVTYARAPASVTLRAVAGRTDWNIEDAAGLMLRVQTRDFLIDPADLVIDGIPTEPLPGDRITDGDYVYEVSAPGPGLPAFTVSGVHRTRLRVHTKYVGPAV